MIGCWRTNKFKFVLNVLIIASNQAARGARLANFFNFWLNISNFNILFIYYRSRSIKNSCWNVFMLIYIASTSSEQERSEMTCMLSNFFALTSKLLNKFLKFNVLICDSKLLKYLIRLILYSFEQWAKRGACLIFYFLNIKPKFNALVLYIVNYCWNIS